MAEIPTLVDRTTLTRHRARARRDALFLHDAVREDVQDRLAMVNKGFTSVAIVTPFPEIWSEAFPEAICVPDEDALALDEAAFDLVIHAVCLHWSNDPVGQLIQCRRALKPDGLCIAASLGGQSLTELRACLSQAEITVSGGLSPRVAPMAEIRELGALLQRAGFALPVADTLTLRTRYRDLFHLCHDLRQMGEANALSARLKHLSRRDLFLQAAALYAENFANADGGLTATFEIVTLTGWAPADTQPKPLRPGSAQARLADALGAAETKLPGPASD